MDPTSFTLLHTQAAEHVPVVEPPSTTPAPIYRPRVQVFADEIPGWPVYPDSLSNTLNGDAALANGDTTASAPSTTPTNYITPHVQETPTVSSAADDDAAAARSFIALATDVGSLPAIPVAISTSQGARLTEMPSSSSASPSRPSARGSQVRFNLIREALNETSEP